MKSFRSTCNVNAKIRSSILHLKRFYSNKKKPSPAHEYVFDENCRRPLSVSHVIDPAHSGSHQIPSDNNNQEPFFRFEILHQSRKSKARVGRIHTPHGCIDTPGFVPVATNAALKGVDIQTVLQHTQLQLMFCNTYHLIVHPGPKIVEQAGGLHKFMNYPRPLITDSGGFQVFSLSQTEAADELKGKYNKQYEATVLKVSEEGVAFRSYRNGDSILLTPETSVIAQKSLGADIIIPLDELPPYHVSEESLTKSFERTHRWEERSLNQHLKNVNKQAMYSVIHGGVNKELRMKSIETLAKLPFDGHAIGGSVGQNRAEMIQLLEFIMPVLLDTKKPIHLLGIGDTASIDACVPLGIDTFDSAYPTRAGRHGFLFSSEGPIHMKRSEHLFSHDEPIDKNCDCHTCKHYSKAYLCHLAKTNEVSFELLGTLHNIHFLMNKMKQFRQQILNDEL